MNKVIHNFSDLESTHLICLLEKEEDLQKLDFLELDDSIKAKIKNVIKKWENALETFFLGTKEIETLSVFYFSINSKQTLIDFLGEKVSKIPWDITVFSDNIHEALTLLDVGILSRYKFQKYKSEKKESHTHVFISNQYTSQVEERMKTLENIVLARDLWETPANDLTPEAFANMVKNTNFKNTKVSLLTPEDIEKKWLNLLHAVWKGSIHKPYIVVLEKISDTSKQTYGIVGKGVTFDTWGIQVKPDNYMYEMKGDMCGAATVFAIMKELDEKDVPVNIVACLCLAENSISWEAYKPSDIIKAYNGKTVDIIHTDAEGRLCLADGMSYISKNYQLDHMITVATLTGAVMVALWFRYAWIMGTDSQFISKCIEYSKENTEKYVELPFDNYFVEKTKSECADIQNLTEWIRAGSSMWAAFLYNFVDNNELYTHIDIAGTAINSFEPYGLMNKWMTGFWVDSISKIFLNL